MVRTQIAVVGVTMEQVESGLSALLVDLRHRAGFRAVNAHWEEVAEYLLVTVDAEGDEVGYENGAAGKSYDAEVLPAD